MSEQTQNEGGSPLMVTIKTLLVVAIAILGLYSAKLGYRFGKDLASSKDAPTEIVRKDNQNG